MVVFGAILNIGERKMDNERRKQLELTLKEINKTAKEKLFLYADSSPDKDCIPFGIKEIDDFMGGGVPLRKFTVDFGGNDTGKSTRALHLIANAQKLGKICCLFDLERKFDKVRSKSLGVVLEDLVLAQTIGTAEECMDAIKIMAEKKIVDLAVVDSIQAMSPKGEQETKKGKKKSIENDEMALLARKLGKFFRVTSADVFRANMSVYLIGQVRQNLGGFFAFADLSGGNALKHWMSICIFSRRGQKNDAPVEKTKHIFTDPDGKEHKKTINKVIGFDCVLKMVKSHIADSARENEDIHIPFYHKTGFKKPEEKSKVIKMVKEELEAIGEVKDVSKAKKELKKLEEKPKKRGRPKGGKNKEKE